ncbi:MAG: sigma-70 family RNA polymerase sigma factor [Bacteroidota bacterium]|nr:sigma-70 family RNA polymerase sigma factor [Bacteroidota bacterium]
MDASLQVNELIMQQNRALQIQEIVVRERKRLLAFIRKRIPSGTDAEDVLQDVFYDLVEATYVTKPIEQVVSWLFKVTRNKIIDLYRKRKSISFEDAFIGSDAEDEERLLIADILPDNMSDANTQMWQTAVMETISEALDELPEEQKEVFVMHELEDMSLKEIAALTNTNVKTLISRKRYAVMYLRDRLQILYNELINS